MSNVVTSNPFILDTAADDVVTGEIKITKIIWDEVAAADNTAQLEDGAERVIWKRTLKEIGTAANEAIPPIPDSDFNPPLLVQGLSVGALTAGKIYVYHVSPNPVKTT